LRIQHLGHKQAFGDTGQSLISEQLVQSKQITPMDGSIHLLAKENSYNLWHHHLGHPFKNALCVAPSHVIGMPSVALSKMDTPCSKGCTLGKVHDCLYPPSDKHATCPL